MRIWRHPLDQSADIIEDLRVRPQSLEFGGADPARNDHAVATQSHGLVQLDIAQRWERHAFQAVDTVGCNLLQDGPLAAAGMNEEQTAALMAQAASAFVERGGIGFDIARGVEGAIEIIHRGHHRHAGRQHLVHEIELRRLVPSHPFPALFRIIRQ